MNQAEFYKKVMSLQLPLSEYYILGGGALLLYGIRKETTDVDLCISTKLFERLKRRCKIDLTSKNKDGFYKLTDYPDVEVVVNDKKDFKCVNIGGDLNLEDIRQILEFKKKRNMNKDKKDIEAIEKFLRKYPNYPNFR